MSADPAPRTAPATAPTAEAPLATPAAGPWVVGVARASSGLARPPRRLPPPPRPPRARPAPPPLPARRDRLSDAAAGAWAPCAAESPASSPAVSRCAPSVSFEASSWAPVAVVSSTEALSGASASEDGCSPGAPRSPTWMASTSFTASRARAADLRRNPEMADLRGVEGFVLTFPWRAALRAVFMSSPQGIGVVPF